MSLPVFLTPEAQQDLRDIWRGLSEFGGGIWMGFSVKVKTSRRIHEIELQHVDSVV